jgi:DnaJ-class molecular chaperone
MQPHRKAVWIECPTCEGTGKMAKEWDFATGAVVARGTCTTCYGKGKVMATPPAPLARELVHA